VTLRLPQETTSYSFLDTSYLYHTYCHCLIEVMEDDEKQSKRLLSSEDSENIPARKHRHLESRVKTPQFILLCVVFEITHFLLVWSVYDGVQRVRSSKLPDLDGRRLSAK
jgi:hypothetical protein